MATSDCQHEWVDDESGDERMFVCLACGQRLEAGPLTTLLLKAGLKLGVSTDPTPQAVILLSWTTEKPTKPGWYWWRDEEGHAVVEVYPTETSTAVWRRGLRYNLNDVMGEWAGPLEPPA